LAGKARTLRPCIGGVGKHSWCRLPCTPTSFSWLSLMKRWFREPTHKALHRGVFRSFPGFLAKVEETLAVTIAKSTSRTATANQILADRGDVALETSTRTETHQS